MPYMLFAEIPGGTAVRECISELGSCSDIVGFRYFMYRVLHRGSTKRLCGSSRKKVLVPTEHPTSRIIVRAACKQ